jgi:hypothetical protein
MLTHARNAKLMMGMINRTDKLDSRGISRLQRWHPAEVPIPQCDLQDRRELPQIRMVSVY